MRFLIKLVCSAAALYLATRVVDGITYHGSVTGLLGVALVFGLINATIKPIVKVISIPAIILTLGLFLLIINGVMLLATSAVAGFLGLGFSVRDFGAAFWGGLLISIVSMVLGAMFDDDSTR